MLGADGAAGKRQLQLSPVAAGVFMRASEPSESMSCRGKMQVSATDSAAARMSGQTTGSSAAGAECRLRTAARSRSFAPCAHQPCGGVVVVGAGVGDGVGLVAVRQVVVRAAVAEAELQDAHAGHVELLAQRVDFRRDEAEVFRDEGQRPRASSRRAKSCAPGRLDPLAVDGGLFFGGDGPVGFEAAEVVEADDVVEGVGAADAVDPPVEAALVQDIPAIERIAPALAGRAEVVGRHAGDADGREVFVELEEIGMGPDVGAVEGDEDGDVADGCGCRARAQ